MIRKVPKHSAGKSWVSLALCLMALLKVAAAGGCSCQALMDECTCFTSLHPTEICPCSDAVVQCLGACNGDEQNGESSGGDGNSGLHMAASSLGAPGGAVLPAPRRAASALRKLGASVVPMAAPAPAGSTTSTTMLQKQLSTTIRKCVSFCRRAGGSAVQCRLRCERGIVVNFAASGGSGTAAAATKSGSGSGTGSDGSAAEVAPTELGTVLSRVSRKCHGFCRRSGGGYTSRACWRLCGGKY